MHDAWFFVGVFVFIFLIWIATGGPMHPLSFTGPRLALPGVLGGGTYLSLPQAPYQIGDSRSTLGGTVGDGGGGSNEPLPTFAGGTAFGTPSAYRGKVFLSRSISGAGSLDPRREYIEIRVAGDAGLPVNISEWKLVSASSGSSVQIPLGTEVPVSGVVNATQPIILAPGERAIVVSGGSPIGASFKENKCIGYFSTFQTFYPALPQNCPAPSDELSARYGSSYINDIACIEKVNSLSRCQVMLSPPTSVSNACQNFMITYLNYNGCLSAHKTDANFKGDTWRVYLGRTSSLWRSKYEIVKLLDVYGNTVDAFSY